MDLDTADPKGLIRESYAIEGIGPAECRSIFLDWALSLGSGAAPAGAAALLLATYADGRDDHPMTAILREVQSGGSAPRRRGGRAARQGGDG